VHQPQQHGDAHIALIVTHRVTEVHHSKELVKVVLHGRPAQQHTASAGQSTQGAVGQRGVIFQAVRPARGCGLGMVLLYC